ncbi:DNA polymerase IV [Metamycoplasma spumans]|uniref:Y-family DNA polymerase n=1 Tax=Metamycoplasma spumans TaxID=92406 RepID=UPI0034DCD305
MDKVIFHIDMDAFFVSCERKMNPELNNKPVVIAQNHKRAIISAMSYELKKIGFRVGDPFFKIKEKVKDVIIVEPHYELYSLISKNVFEYIQKNFTDKIEIYSIDEYYLDVSDLVNEYRTKLDLAKEIQRKILKDLNLPCSIGISYSKFLAKMSTNKAKPFGILETKQEDIEKHFYDLPVEKIFGIGRKMAPVLKANNIHTYRDLVNFKNELLLRKILTKNYYIFIERLKGNKEITDHVFKEEVKGIGNSITFLNDLKTQTEALEQLRNLVNNVSARAIDQNQEGCNISISIRNTSRIWSSKQKKFNFYTNDPQKIYSWVLYLFEDFWDEKPIRGLGVKLNNLRSVFYNNEQIDLLEDKKLSEVNKLIYELNFKMGKNLLKTGAQLAKEKNKDKHNIRFLRRDIHNQNIIFDIENEKTDSKIDKNKE